MKRWVGTMIVLSGLATSCVRSVDLPEQLEGVTITGQLVAKDASTGDWRGLEGAAVSVRGSTFRATTNEAGAFKLDRLPLNIPLSLDFVGPREMGAPVRARSLDPIVGLVDGQAITLGTVRLSPGGSVEGRVLLGESEPALDAGGTLVVAVGTSFRAITDAEGGFKLRGLPEGSFELAIFRTGYRSGRIEGVQVTPASTTTLSEVTLVPGEDSAIMITGSAKRADVSTDSGHFGISLKFTNDTSLPGAPEISETALTDDEGAYSLSLPAGIYRLVASEASLNSVTLTGIAVLAEGVLGLPALSLSTRVEGDFDNDGIPDADDDDDDNDGCLDFADAFPLDPAYCFDNDEDGIANEIDPDDDNDGLLDAEESTEGLDGWVTNPLNDDSDGDGVKDGDDLCPTVPDDQTDTNQNGVGDACEEDAGPVTVIPEPRVTGFAPAIAGAGDTISIFGENLVDSTYPTVVQFGLPTFPGIPVIPFEASSTVLRVSVPVNAKTGTIRVFAGGQSATSTRAFTYQDGPRIVEVSPRAGRVGSRVRLIGENFNNAGLFADINGEPATILDRVGETGVVQVYQVIVQGRPYEAIDIAVPNTLSGLINVRTDFGSGSSPTNFQVEDAGIVVTAVTPSVVPVGATLRVQGFGFSTTDIVSPSPVRVIFNYDATHIPQDILPGSVNTQILVTVPSGAISGRIAIEHPAADQPVVSAIALSIDPLAPVISSASDTVIMVGDTLSLYGANLGDATSVTFTGGAQAANLAGQGSSEIQVTVPAGINPGPVTVVTPTSMSTSLVEFSVLEISDPLIIPRFSSGGGAAIIGSQEVAVLNSNGQAAYIVGLGTGIAAPTLNSEIDLIPVNGTSLALDAFTADPSGQFGTFIFAGGVRVFRIPSFTHVGDCPFGGAGPGSAVRIEFDDLVNAAYVPKASSSATSNTAGFVRIDLANPGACTEVDVTVSNPNTGHLVRVLPRPNQELLLTHLLLGSATIDANPTSLTYDQLITPWQVPTISANRLLPALSGNVLISAENGLLQHYEPFSTLAPQTVFGARVRETALGGQGRYLLITRSSQHAIVDTSASPPRVVRRTLTVSAKMSTAVPGQSVWLSGDQTGSSYRRVEIRAP